MANKVDTLALCDSLVQQIEDSAYIRAWLDNQRKVSEARNLRSLHIACLISDTLKAV